MDHQDNIEILQEQRRAAESHQPSQFPPGGLEADDPIYVSSNSPETFEIGYFQVSEEDRQAERTGGFASSSSSKSPSASPTDNKAALKDKYKELYQQREEIQNEMDAIKMQLTEEEYEALVKEIEKPQLATLKGL